MQITSTKRCTGPCGKTKPLEDFGPRTDVEDGRQSRCRPCAAEISQQWRSDNLEKSREISRRYYADNREKRAEYDRERYDPEKKAEYNRQYYAANREKILEQTRRWQAENPDKVITNNARQKARRNATYGKVCYLCGEEIQQDDMDIDHVLSKRLGGTDAKENLRATHEACNESKAAVLLEDYLTRIETTYLYWQDIAKLTEPVLALAI